MKKLKYSSKLFSMLALVVSLTLVYSCREDAKKEEADTKTETTTSGAEFGTKTETPATSEAIAKNPAHGQPGHRCDIPVGAPLNSPPANTNSASPVINNSGSPVINGGTAKINPPHGQPGHRCDVKVGDPL
jgi:hypothetical protein